MVWKNIKSTVKYYSHCFVKWKKLEGIELADHNKHRASNYEYLDVFIIEKKLLKCYVIKI